MHIKETPVISNDIVRFKRFFKQKRGCWEWNGYCGRDGYGTFKIAGKTISAHRMAWTVYKRDIRFGEQVLHSCDNPSCVNPAHLFLGDHSTNMLDMVLKGRSAKGERQGKTILKKKDVIALRLDYAQQWGTQAELASKYGVCRSTVSNIVNRIFWGHI